MNYLVVYNLLLPSPLSFGNRIIDLILQNDFLRDKFNGESIRLIFNTQVRSLSGEKVKPWVAHVTLFCKNSSVDSAIWLISRGKFTWAEDWKHSLFIHTQILSTLELRDEAIIELEYIWDVWVFTLVPHVYKWPKFKMRDEFLNKYTHTRQVWNWNISWATLSFGYIWLFFLLRIPNSRVNVIVRLQLFHFATWSMYKVTKKRNHTHTLTLLNWVWWLATTGREAKKVNQ